MCPCVGACVCSYVQKGLFTFYLQKVTGCGLRGLYVIYLVITNSRTVCSSGLVVRDPPRLLVARAVWTLAPVSNPSLFRTHGPQK